MFRDGGERNSLCRNGSEEVYPPCRFACPANVNVQAYVALISNGRFKEALDLIRKEIPFPAVCGRICFAPCEEACVRNNVDSHVEIRLLKRLASEYEFSVEKSISPEKISPTQNKKVAIIGGGPAGLTAAYELLKLGYPVTLFERESRLGGMLRLCLPEYRLPEYVLDAEIRYIIESGIEVKTSVNIGEDLKFNDLWEMGFNAVFIATGTPKCSYMNIEGEDLAGVFHALNFLKDVRSKKINNLGGRVAVIGGGNVAIDCARTAMRLGPEEVLVVYRRVRGDMRAHPKEVEEAEEEGVRFLFQSLPKRFVGKGGKVNAIECFRTRLEEIYPSGPRRPISIQGSEFLLPVDNVIIAVGESADLSFLPDEISISKNNVISVDPTTFETEVKGVFAGGDVVTGPLSVIDAISSGKKAARAIDLYLKGGDLKSLKLKSPRENTWVREYSCLERKLKPEIRHLQIEERKRGFKEVEIGFKAEDGVKEALRCVHCGPCSTCLANEDLCELDYAIVDVEKCSECGICASICPYEAVTKTDDNKPVIDTKICKGCGVCASSCPERAISMKNFSDELLLQEIFK